MQRARGRSSELSLKADVGGRTYASEAVGAVNGLRLSRRGVLAALPLAGLLLTSCTRPAYEYSYRLTLSIDVNGATHTGSSVVHERGWVRQTLDAGLMADSSIRGEAATVDLGDGRVLVALLYSPTNFLLADNGLPVGTPTDPSVIQALEADRQAHELSDKQLPQLIAFLRAGDPNSAVLLDPNDLSAALGPGVRLRSAQIEVTDSPVTTGIERLLPWLAPRLRAEAKGGLVVTPPPPDWAIDARKSNGDTITVYPRQLERNG
jgi:hypothetical protein